MTTTGRIAKNTTYLTIAFVGQKILSFLFFIAIARLAGVENTGKYFFAMSFVTIFTIFADFGLSAVLTREVAKDVSRAKRYLANVLGAKTILISLTYLVMIGIVHLLRYDALTRQLVYVAGLVMVLDSIHLTVYALFRGLQRLKYEAIGIFTAQVIIVGFGTTALFLGWPLVMLIVAFLLGSIFNVIYSTTLLIIKAKIRPALSWETNTLKMLFRIALPFALAGMFVKGYTHIDSVLLSKMMGDEAVGFYSVPFKITFALQFIPMGFAAAIFPAMSQYFVSSKELLARTFEKSMFYLMVLAVPIAFGIASLAPEIITVIYGQDYSPSIPALQIIIFSVIFIFLNFPVGSLLNATNRQTANTTFMGISMLINIILNLILIPKFSFVGASIASLVSMAFLFISALLWTNKVLSFKRGWLLITSLKVILAAILMSAAIISLRPFMYFIWLIPIGAAVYFLVLFVLKGISKDDIAKVWRAVFKRQAEALKNVQT